jgi:RHS repeat-associated protein
MTDNAGNQIGTAVKYLPFGETRASVTVPTDKLFTGQRLDGTGLYYYNARYYDPTIGRFISPDTVIPNLANPQCFNRYSYCLNNPLKYTDPSGHEVDIAGVDVRDIEKAVKSGDYSKLSEIGKKTAGSGGLLIAYGTLRGVEKDVCTGLENSTNVFNVLWTQKGYGYTTPTIGKDNSYDIGLPEAYKDDTKGAAVIFAHEALHASRCDIFGPYSNSKYEEALASHFKRRVAIDIGYVANPWDFETYGLIGQNMSLSNLVPFEFKSEISF